MPRQATAGRIEVSQTIDCSLIPDNSPAALFQKTATISPGVNTVRFKKVPKATATQASLQLFVPDEPNDEDTYSVVDEDGSASPASVVGLFPPTGSTATIGATGVLSGPFGAFIILVPSSTTDITYDGDNNNWEVAQSPNPNLATVGFAATEVGEALDNQNAPAAVPILAFLFQPAAGGLARLTFALEATASGADTLQLDIEAIPNVTTLSGGTRFGGLAPALQPEGRFAGGGAIVITGGGAPTTIFSIKKKFQADDDANQYVPFSGLLQTLQFPPTQNLLIVVKLTGAANYSAMSLMADVQSSTI